MVMRPLPPGARAPVIQASFAAGRPPPHLVAARAGAPALQRQATSPPPGMQRGLVAFPAPAGVAGSGGGTKLTEPVRRAMEALFGSDFAAVRVHVGSLPAALGAIAFTAGADIHFAPGHYAPETARGRRLLGHELAHVVQQRAGRVANPLGRAAVVHDPLLEAEAERMAQRAAALPAPAPARAVQRATRFPGRAAVVQRADVELSDVSTWQRPRDLAKHLREQARIYAIIDQAALRVLGAHATERERLLKNTCEMIQRRDVVVTVLSRATLIPANDAGQQAYFDALVSYPATGGTYGSADDGHIYRKELNESAHADHHGIIRIFDPEDYDVHQLTTILIHETQHEADWHDNFWREGLAGVDAPTEARAESYRSEFRAYWLGGIPAADGSDTLPLASAAATNAKSVSYKVPGDLFATSRATHFANARQQAIFWHMASRPATYEYVARLYVTSAQFRAMVDGLTRPVGGNLLNSIRIDALRSAIIGLAVGDRATKYARIQQATAALDAADKAHLADVAASQPFWAFVTARTDATGADVKKLTTAEVQTLRTAVGL